MLLDRRRKIFLEHLGDFCYVSYNIDQSRYGRLIDVTNNEIIIEHINGMRTWIIPLFEIRKFNFRRYKNI